MFAKKRFFTRIVSNFNSLLFMRFKIIIASLFAIILLGGYTFLGLPFITESVYYKDYILAYRGYIDQGISTLVILIGTYILSLIFDSILAHTFGRSLKDNSLAKKIFPLIKKIVSFFIWSVSLVFILSTFWINISALVTGAGVGGVLFALASKEAISNLFGSLSLIFSHNFKIGDTIRVKGLEGVVEEISISYTRLVDKKGSAIFMPNKLIVSETIENLSMAPSKKAEFAFDTGVQLDTKTAKKFLEWLENDIEKLEKTHGPLHTKVSIEGLWEKWLNILVKIDSESENMAKIKREIWLLIREKMEEFKTA